MSEDRVSLLLDADAEGFHFAVEVAAFEAKGFGGAGDVAVALVELLEDEVALVGFAGFDESGEVFGAGALAVAVGFAGGLRSSGKEITFVDPETGGVNLIAPSTDEGSIGPSKTTAIWLRMFTPATSASGTRAVTRRPMPRVRKLVV